MRDNFITIDAKRRSLNAEKRRSQGCEATGEDVAKRLQQLTTILPTAIKSTGLWFIKFEKGALFFECF